MASVSTARYMSTGNHGVSAAHPTEATCLSRNPMESVFSRGKLQIAAQKAAFSE
jgi:hypothetical protein